MGVRSMTWIPPGLPFCEQNLDNVLAEKHLSNSKSEKFEADKILMLFNSTENGNTSPEYSTKLTNEKQC